MKNCEPSEVDPDGRPTISSFTKSQAISMFAVGFGPFADRR
jgi:hypothetical protein